MSTLWGALLLSFWAIVLGGCTVPATCGADEGCAEGELCSNTKHVCVPRDDEVRWRCGVLRSGRKPLRALPAGVRCSGYDGGAEAAPKDGRPADRGSADAVPDARGDGPRDAVVDGARDGGCRGGCLIGGRCRAKGESRTRLGCDVCDPAKDRRAWTKLPCVRTVAGRVTPGFKDGTGAAAAFRDPAGLARLGSTLYVADSENHRIRAVDLTTGAVTTLAGRGTFGYKDGTGAAAAFAFPMAVVPAGGTLYVADASNNRVRAVALATRVVTTVAGSGQRGYKDGPGGVAAFYDIRGLAARGGVLYVAGYGNTRVRTVQLATRRVGTLAGGGAPATKDGVGTAAGFESPWGLALAVRTLYVADDRNNRIRAVDVTTRRVTTVAGSGARAYADGVGTKAAFKSTAGLAIGPKTLYVADQRDHRIRAIDLATRRVTTVAGTGKPGHVDGLLSRATFRYPTGLVLSGRTLYVSDEHAIRAIRLP